MTKDTPSLSIVMAVFNRLELTEKCLKSLEKSLDDAVNYEVIIVDDRSTDGTRDFLKTLNTDRYRIIFNEEKANFAINNNRAVKIARAPTLCLLNNDTELSRGWLEPMLKALDQLKDAGCIGNVQRIHSTGRYDHFGICFPTWLTPIHFGQHRKKALHPQAPYSRWGAVTAACILIHKKVFQSVGGFCEDYQNGCEDIDLCLRLHQRGHWHYVVHESEILHHKGASPGRKQHNEQNLEKLKQTWGNYINAHFVARDGRLAATNYIRSAIAAPERINGPKLLNSICTLLKAQTSNSLRVPEWIDPTMNILKK